MDGEKTCETCRHFRRHYVKKGAELVHTHQAGPLRRTPHPVQADGYARLPPLLRGAEKGRLNVQPPFFQALSLARGRVTVKVEPLPTALSSVRVPP